MKRKTFLSCVLAACLSMCTACKNSEAANDSTAKEEKSSVTTINLNDYINKHYQGYNTIATDGSVIDIGNLILDNRSLFGLTIDATEIQFQPIKSCLKNNIIYTIEKESSSESSYLSNGDTLVVDYDEEKIQALNKTIESEGRWNVQFSFEDTTFIVEDIPELFVYNLDELITIYKFEDAGRYGANALIEYKDPSLDEDGIRTLTDILYTFCDMTKSELGDDYVNIKINNEKVADSRYDDMVEFESKKGVRLSQDSYDIKCSDPKEKFPGMSINEIYDSEEFNGEFAIIS